ncbi:MAG: hypothetical protein V4642_13090 [Bacteroidota bacterium]
MGRSPSFPSLLDAVHTVSITKLKEWGYLEKSQYKTGVITWSINGRKTGSIRITVDTHAYPAYMVLDYTIRDKPINYKVFLAQRPSNLGKGSIYYFVCPHTGKLCRKLYNVGEKFLHRKAWRNVLYEKQTHSHSTRDLYKQFDGLLKRDKKYEQLSEPYFKKTYNGRPTKRYWKLIFGDLEGWKEYEKE